jgi:hypothetical protein
MDMYLRFGRTAEALSKEGHVAGLVLLPLAVRSLAAGQSVQPGALLLLLGGAVVPGAVPSEKSSKFASLRVSPSRLPRCSQDTPWGRQFSFDKPEVRSYLTDAARMWLDEFNMDGLRIDSVHNQPWDLSQVSALTLRVEEARRRGRQLSRWLRVTRALPHLTRGGQLYMCMARAMALPLSSRDADVFSPLPRST